MKINFKKIASIIATTAMLGSTIAFASAALSLPASDNVVVYGNALDSAAAIDMASVLVSASGATTIAGDNVKLEKSSNKYNLGNAMNSFYSTLDEDQLSKVLAKGTYQDDGNTEYAYEQSIVLGNANLTHFQSDDFNDAKPVIGFDLPSDYGVLNYTLDFTPDALKRGQLETTELTMLGTSYYVLKEENSSKGIKLTLLDNANSAIVADGTPKTITVGDKSYSINIVYVGASDVILEVDGVKTNKLQEGSVFKVASDTYVAVKNILYNNKDTGISQVEISIGSGKIVLEDKQEVEMNDKPISDTDKMKLYASFDNDSSTISGIKLGWSLEDEKFLAPGSELVLPGFKTIKLSMTGFNAPKAETTTIEAKSDSIFQVKTTLTDGAINLPIFYNNDTNILGLGEKAKHKLVTSSGHTGTTLTLNETEKTYFPVTYIDGDNAESYVYEIDSITGNDGKNTTVLKNLAGGSDITLSEVGKDKDIAGGNINVKLASANELSHIATVTLTASSSGVLYLDRLTTKEGMTFKLPVDSATVSGDGYINITGAANTTAQPTQWIMNFTEENKDAKIQAGGSFRTTLTANAGDGFEPSAVSGIDAIETVDGSKVFEGYVISDLATKIMWDKPTDNAKSMDVIYAGEESTADVYVSESSSVISSTGTVAPVLASAMTAADKAKNLIVVGGSCVNTVAAKLLTGLETPVCSAAFSAKTTVGAGQYMIKGFTSPYATDKIAVLIAGYEAAQTTDAVKAAKALTSMTNTTNVVAPKLV